MRAELAWRLETGVTTQQGWKWLKPGKRKHAEVAVSLKLTPSQTEQTHLALSWATTVGQTLNPDSNLILNWPTTKYKPSLKKRTENSQLVVVADDNAYCHLRHLSGHFCLSYSWLSCWAVILFDQWSYGWSSSSSWVVALLTWLSPSGHLHERSGGRCQANITLIIFTTSSGVSSTILLVHQLDYC